MIRQRESLIARVRQLRRVAAATAAPDRSGAPEPPIAGDTGSAARLDALEERIAHLEQLLEGFQDSVHREALRQGKRISEIETQIQPAALGAALTKDARERGL